MVENKRKIGISRKNDESGVKLGISLIFTRSLVKDGLPNVYLEMGDAHDLPYPLCSFSKLIEKQRRSSPLRHLKTGFPLGADDLT